MLVTFSERKHQIFLVCVHVLQCAQETTVQINVIRNHSSDTQLSAYNEVQHPFFIQQSANLLESLVHLHLSCKQIILIVHLVL